MDVIIREPQENELNEAVKLAKRIFGLVGNIIISKPEKSLVAMADDKVVGGVFLKSKSAGSKKFGIVDFIFTDPNFKGHGISGKLLDESCRILWEQDFKGLMAYVQDDNVASWKLFEKHGFVRTSFLQTAKAFGFASALKAQAIFTSFGFCVGADFYIALPEKEETEKYERRCNSLAQIVVYLLVSAVLVSLMLIQAAGSPILLVSLAAVLLGSIVVGWVGTALTKRKWHFRLTQGGFFLTTIMSIFFFFPMIANWYPDHYENTPQFKRDLALNSILVWILLLALSASRWFVNGEILNGARGVASVLLIFKCLPFMPMSSHGSGRVFAWNKPVFFMLAIVSVLLVFVL